MISEKWHQAFVWDIASEGVQGLVHDDNDGGAPGADRIEVTGLHHKPGRVKLLFQQETKVSFTLDFTWINYHVEFTWNLRGNR